MDLIEQKPLPVPTSPVKPDEARAPPLSPTPPTVPAAAVAAPFPRVGMVSNPDF